MVSFVTGTSDGDQNELEIPEGAVPFVTGKSDGDQNESEIAEGCTVSFGFVKESFLIPGSKVLAVRPKLYGKEIQKMKEKTLIHCIAPYLIM